MTLSATALSTAWDDAATVRTSLAWWIAAVLSGATLATAGYFVGPGDTSLLFAFTGLLIGFFAPYALAVAWNLTRSSSHKTAEDWAKVAPIVRRTQ